MNRKHLALFSQSMKQNDLEGAFEHVSEHITLLSPIFDKPFTGKADAIRVIRAVKLVVDSTSRTGFAESEDRVVAFNAIKLGSVTGESIEMIQVDHDGFVDRITVMWRPLSALLEGRKRLSDFAG